MGGEELLWKLPSKQVAVAYQMREGQGSDTEKLNWQSQCGGPAARFVVH